MKAARQPSCSPEVSLYCACVGEDEDPLARPHRAEEEADELRGEDCRSLEPHAEADQGQERHSEECEAGAGWRVSGGRGRSAEQSPAGKRREEKGTRKWEGEEMGL